MLGFLPALLLVAAQQASEPPFSLDLPDGYRPFLEAEDNPGNWVADRADDQATFRVHHFLLGSLGAKADLVAEDIRKRSWEPTLRSKEHTIEPWAGDIDGIEAAGWVIHYLREKAKMMVLQRIAIQGDNMIVLVWEGPQAAGVDAGQRLDSFRIPEAWISLPQFEVDIYRGLGPDADHQPFPGRLEIHVEVPALAVEPELRITMTYTPGLAPVPGGEFHWQLPAGASALPLDDSLGGRRIRYSLPVGEEADLGAAYGLTRIGKNSFSALDPLWLAIPSPALTGANLQPPGWHMAVTHLANMEVLSAPLVKKDYLEETKALFSDFRPVPAGVAWPFFLVGDFEAQQTSGHNWHLRLDSKAKLDEDAMRELVRLSKVLEEWLPGGTPSWTVGSFPWIGDRVLPHLIILDEQRGWFQEPVDAPFEGLTRRVALARLLCQQRCGIQQHGQGSAALFLETSLAEFLTYRLLQASGNAEDAQAMVAHWRSKELLAGPLPQPLSTLQIGDLYGPRRLLSFGPLVWLAIEQACGREAFDGMIGEVLAAPGWWSTRELETLLENAAPEFDWDPFLVAHLYGRTLPDAP